MEIWKEIKGYEGLYKINNNGQVFSYKNNRMLKQSIDSSGYYCVGLSDKNSKIFRIHKLMAITFLNHIPNKYTSVIDHVDNNKLNNCIDNIQIISQRKNLTKDRKKNSLLGTSFYKGKYHVRFWINGKNTYLGAYLTERDANLAYRLKLKEHELYLGGYLNKSKN
jgi:hypothetical protein